jgi:hypothetical protein
MGREFLGASHWVLTGRVSNLSSDSAMDHPDEGPREKSPEASYRSDDQQAHSVGRDCIANCRMRAVPPSRRRKTAPLHTLRRCRGTAPATDRDCRKSALRERAIRLPWHAIFPCSLDAGVSVSRGLFLARSQIWAVSGQEILWNHLKAIDLTGVRGPAENEYQIVPRHFV